MRVDLRNIFRVLVQIGISIDDAVKVDGLHVIANLFDTVDSAHDQLVNVPLYQKLWLAAQQRLHNAPDYLLVLRVYFEHVAKVNDDGCGCLEHSAKEAIVWK